MDEAETLCARIAIVDGGKIIAIGTPAELKAMVKGSDRIELEVVGDAEKIIAMLRGQPGVHDVTRDPEGPIIVSADDGAHGMPRLISEMENAGGKVSWVRSER